jgi:alkylmercury lyase
MVESFCPATKSKICLTLSPDGVERYEPANAVLSMVVPEPNPEGPKSAEEIWKVFCRYVFFFSSAEVITEWFRKGLRSYYFVDTGRLSTWSYDV